MEGRENSHWASLMSLNNKAYPRTRGFGFASDGLDLLPFFFGIPSFPILLSFRRFCFPSARPVEDLAPSTPPPRRRSKRP
jgi:hypothetical protein